MTDIAPSENKIQQESVQFNQPVSEAAGSSIGALANFLREAILPVGTVVYSMLDESTFQNENTAPTPERWVLADGRSVIGSRYETLTGNSNIPDLRGIILRGKNYGRSGGTGNPDGDQPVGTYQGDQFASHDHSFSDPGHHHTQSPDFGNAGNQYASGSARQALAQAPFGTGFQTATAGTGINFVGQGGNETRMRNVTLNAFIRVN